MWLLGLASVVVVSALIVQIAYRRIDRSQPPQIWDLKRMAGAYPAVVGPLAGFAVASTILLVTLNARAANQSFQEVIGGLILAFLGFVVAAVAYATTTGLADAHSQPSSTQEIIRALFVLSNAFFYLSLVGSWVVLPLMLAFMDLPALGWTLAWVAFAVVAGGAVWQAAWLSNLRLAGTSSPILMPSVAIALSLAYSNLFASNVPGLWPPNQPTLTLELLNYGLGLVGFIWTMLLITAPHDHPRGARLRATRNYLPAYIQATITLATLQWFSTIAP